METDVIEEARILVANPDLCAIVTELFTDAGIAAYGDYRDEPEEVLIRDAFADAVDYVVFANVWHLLEKPNFYRKTNNDLTAKVYVRRESGVRTMTVAAAIKMILERRHMKADERSDARESPS